MLRVFLGTDRKKLRAAVAAVLKGSSSSVLRITDAHTLGDLSATLAQGPSIFGESRTVLLDGVCASEEMRALLLSTLPILAESPDTVLIVEEKVDADTKKKLQKFASSVEVFDAVKKKEYPTIFRLADSLKKGDKKNLWIGYQRELAAGNAPEAIHGVLFWGAKQFFLAARNERAEAHGRRLVVTLAELPHESRRRGEDLEYALERFILSFPAAGA